jgi:hypothetical protein
MQPHQPTQQLLQQQAPQARLLLLPQPQHLQQVLQLALHLLLQHTMSLMTATLALRQLTQH